jgi:voltage-gated potassium channel Kch
MSSGADAAQSWSARQRARRFQILFVLLLATIVASPVVEALALGGWIRDVLLYASLLAAGLGGIGVGSGVPVVVLVVLFAFTRSITGTDGADLFLVAAAVLAGIAAMREALRSGTVGAERLYAAACVYLLAGLAFAMAYRVLALFDPGSVVVVTAPEQPIDFATAIYFSFVTLATLGYGDVVPVSPVARSLAIVESVGAQLFVAILIARLVGLQARAPE